MLNKKRLFALLMVGALLPAGVNAVNEGAGEQPAAVQGAGDAGAGDAAGDQGAQAADANAAQAQPAGPGYVDQLFNKLSWPLQTALARIAQMKATTKTVLTGVLGYVAYAAHGKVLEDVQALPDKVRGFVGGCGVDCDGE